MPEILQVKHESCASSALRYPQHSKEDQWEWSQNPSCFVDQLTAWTNYNILRRSLRNTPHPLSAEFLAKMSNLVRESAIPLHFTVKVPLRLMVGSPAN